MKKQNVVSALVSTLTQTLNGKTLVTQEEFFEAFEGQVDFSVQNSVADIAKDTPLDCEDGLYHLEDLVGAFIDAEKEEFDQEAVA